MSASFQGCEYLLKLELHKCIYLFGCELVELERAPLVVDDVAFFVPLGWQQALIRQRAERQSGLQDIQMT